MGLGVVTVLLNDYSLSVKLAMESATVLVMVTV